MRSALTIAVLALCVAGGAQPARAQNVPTPRAAAPVTQDAYAVDARGRRFRVAFPPHDRFFFEAVTPVAVSGQGAFRWAEYAMAWLVSLRADFPEEEIWWQMRHDLLATTFRAPSRGGWNLSVDLVQADYLRHDTSAFVVVPGEANYRFPAPFDVVVQYGLGGFRMRAGGGLVFRRIDVARVAVLADFLRDPDYRHRLAIGAAGRYRMSRPDGGSTWRHGVVPMSGIRALWAWESARGLFRVALHDDLEYGVSFVGSAEPTWAWSDRASAELEWLLLAVDDMPLSLRVGASMTTEFDRAAVADWSARIGLRLSFPTAS